MRLAQGGGLWLAIGAGFIASALGGFAIVLALVLRRAFVEVREDGIALSGGFVRRGFPKDEIGRIALVRASYGAAQRLELRVLDHQGRKLYGVIGDLFNADELLVALKRLSIPIDNQWGF
jgi:hypothetical protein